MSDANLQHAQSVAEAQLRLYVKGKARIAELETKLEAAEKDLEWLEKMARAEGYYPVFGYMEHEDGLIPEADNPYFYILDPGKDEPTNWVGYGKTLRQAVAAARQAEEKSDV